MLVSKTIQFLTFCLLEPCICTYNRPTRIILTLLSAFSIISSILQCFLFHRIERHSCLRHSALDFKSRMAASLAVLLRPVHGHRSRLLHLHLRESKCIYCYFNLVCIYIILIFIINCDLLSLCFYLTFILFCRLLKKPHLSEINGLVVFEQAYVCTMYHMSPYMCTIFFTIVIYIHTVSTQTCHM